jgi:hypothetical protein
MHAQIASLRSGTRRLRDHFRAVFGPRPHPFAMPDWPRFLLGSMSFVTWAHRAHRRIVRSFAAHCDSRSTRLTMGEVTVLSAGYFSAGMRSVHAGAPRERVTEGIPTGAMWCRTNARWVRFFCDSARGVDPQSSAVEIADIPDASYDDARALSTHYSDTWNYVIKPRPQPH